MKVKLDFVKPTDVTSSTYRVSPREEKTRFRIDWQTDGFRIIDTKDNHDFTAGLYTGQPTHGPC